jgi:tRNA (cytidine/uridine-2'-O-)-methyltransferase
MALRIVLYQPEIPQNTGNIARTCAATGSELHLIRPLGFKTDDKHLKRAGLDYWHLLSITYHDSLESFLGTISGPYVFATKTAARAYSDFRYRSDTCIVFGRETSGLPDHLLRTNRDRCIRIPMVRGARSLNLSNSVAIVAYEALRQLGFPALETAHTSATT